MNALKKQKKTKTPTARPDTAATRVPSPTVPGSTDSPQRVVDSLSAMFKRKHLTSLQYRAGEIFRDAFEEQTGSMGGSMDFDRVRGGGQPGQPPAERFAAAVQRIEWAKSALYPHDYRMVFEVCGIGRTVEQAAEYLLGRPATRREKEDAGRRLSAGLTRLADLWLPKERQQGGAGGNVRGYRTEDHVVTETQAVPAATRVAHATSERVYHHKVKA